MSVAIIGGGPSGLVTAKEMKECGLRPTVFEQERSIGGVWNADGGKVWDNLRTNNSRYNMSFSDCDWDKNSEDFPNGKKVFDYLCQFAKMFHLHNDVKLSCKVTKVERRENQWSVEWVQHEQTKETDLFDFLIVASGFCSRGYVPPIPGIESFPGSVTHSEDYKTPYPFQEKVVAVIGNSFSGTEVASEIAERAKKVFHIYRNPIWVTSRHVKEQETGQLFPFDLLFSRQSQSRFVGIDLSKRYEQTNRDLSSLCREQKAMCPDLPMPPISDHPPFVTISDTYLTKVKETSVVPMLGAIERIERNTLFLSEERRIEVDQIVFCTGFRTHLPFLDNQMQERLNFQEEHPILPLPLYKTVFHPRFPHAAFVGLSRFGIYFGLIELQARWAALTFSGHLPYASEKEMQEGIQKEEMIRYRKKSPQFPFNYLDLCDRLAKEIGAMPDLTKLKEEDPKLYEQFWSRPFTTTSFRVTGFGKNPSLFREKMEEFSVKVNNPLQSPQYSYSHSRE